jgi:hypothetical protein
MMLSTHGSGTRRGRDLRRRESMIGVALFLAFALLDPPPSFAKHAYQVDDVHFHLTNYVQEDIALDTVAPSSPERYYAVYEMYRCGAR